MKRISQKWNRLLNHVATGCLAIVCLSLLIAPIYAALTEEVERIAWSPNGTKIAIAAGAPGCDPNTPEDYAVRILDVATSQIVRRFAGHSCRLVDVAWSPDGAKIGSSSFDGTAFIWDALTGDLLVAGHFQTEIGVAVVWSPDSTRIASIGSGGKYAFVWDATTGEQLFNLPEHEDFTTSVAWSPDGSRIATSALDSTIKISDVTTHQEIRSLQYSSSIYWVAWHPDSGKLASGGSDGAVQIWDSRTGQLLDVFQGHTASVERVAWSPDGSRIASGSSDGTIRVWDAATGQVLEIIQSNAGPIVDLAWKPDGSQLAYIGRDSGAQSSMVEIVSVSQIAAPTARPCPSASAMPSARPTAAAHPTPST